MIFTDFSMQNQKMIVFLQLWGAIGNISFLLKEEGDFVLFYYFLKVSDQTFTWKREYLNPEPQKWVDFDICISKSLRSLEQYDSHVSVFWFFCWELAAK